MDGDNCSDSQVKRFNQLPQSRKVIITMKKYPQYQSVYAINRKDYPQNQPLERNNSIISQVGTQLILDSAVNSPFNAVNTSMVKANSGQDWFGDIVQVDIDQLAYILFTSGSTGVP